MKNKAELPIKEFYAEIINKFLHEKPERTALRKDFSNEKKYV
jgi:hypothetical protein